MVEGAAREHCPTRSRPVIAGTGGAAWLHAACGGKRCCAARRGGDDRRVNYANDYSDGIRGTDDDRAGPLASGRSKLAAPRAVLTAAVVSLGVAAAAGVVLAWFSAPWLIAVGALCIAGAWLYTGGFEAVRLSRSARSRCSCSSAGRSARHAVHPGVADRLVGLALAVAMGSLSSAVLVGQQSARHPHRRPVRQDHAGGAARGNPHPGALPGVGVVALALTLVLISRHRGVAVGLIAAPLAVRATGPVRKAGLGGKELIPVLRDTGLTMLVWAVAVGAWP